MRFMNKAGIVGLLGAVVWISWGCSSSGGGDNGGGGSFDCSAGCETVLKTACPNDTMQECVADCEESIAEAGSCGGQLKSLLSCAVTQPFYCDASGTAEVSDESIMSSCYSQVIASQRCEICLADASDSPCMSCFKASCCAELQAIMDDPSFKSYLTCYNACTDDACEKNCLSSHPSVQQKQVAAASCQTSKCASACSP